MLKYLKKQDKKRIKYIISEIENLATSMDNNSQIKKLQGKNSYYRLQIKYDLRIIFTKDDCTIKILIVKIGHRREIYKRLS